MKLLLAISTLLLLSCHLPAADYYVSPIGKDKSSGSLDQPFRTIARAIQAARNPGDSVVVRAGTYRQDRTLNLPFPGSKEKPVTLRNYPGETVVIDGSDTPKDANLIAILSHHIRITGLTIQNARGDGISIWGPGSRVHHVQAISNVIHHCHRSGIFASFNSLNDPVRDITLESNTISQVCQMNQDKSQNKWSFALGAGLSKNVVIRGNTVSKSYGEGIGLYLSESGVIEGNVVSDCFSVNVYLDNTTHSRVERNFVYSTRDPKFYRFNHPASGIQVANENYNRFAKPSSHNIIINNILVGNRYAFYYGNYQLGGGLRDTLFANNTAVGSTDSLLHIDPDKGHQNSRIVNNIFQQTSNARITDIEGPTDHIQFSNNLWFGGIPHPQARDKSDTMANPKLATPNGNKPVNFQPASDSTALKVGIELNEVTNDFLGNSRPDKPDIGAFQISK